MWESVVSLTSLFLLCQRLNFEGLIFIGYLWECLSHWVPQLFCRPAYRLVIYHVKLEEDSMSNYPKVTMDRKNSVLILCFYLLGAHGRYSRHDQCLYVCISLPTRSRCPCMLMIPLSFSRPTSFIFVVHSVVVFQKGAWASAKIRPLNCRTSA